MALFVNTNIAALNGQKNLMNVTSRMNSSFEKLSSGSRINSARDDSAGLQISDRLSTQITGLNQASRNANDGISIAQIAEGALGEVTNNIQRMRQLVVQGGNRTLSSDDREALTQEFEKLLNVNNDIADRTAYGTLKILNGDSPESGYQIQSGAYAGQQDTVTTGNAELSALFGKLAGEEVDSLSGTYEMTAASLMSIGGTVQKMVAIYAAVTETSNLTSAADLLFGSSRDGNVSQFGLDGGSGELNVAEFAKILEKDASDLVISTFSNVANALGSFGMAHIGFASHLEANLSNGGMDDANLNGINAAATDYLLDTMSSLITQVDKQRAKLGAEQNGLTSTVRNNTTAAVNVSDSRARIQDTDFAAETAELTRNQIIQQASTTILSQANQLPQTALSLLR